MCVAETSPALEPDKQMEANKPEWPRLERFWPDEAGLDSSGLCETLGILTLLFHLMSAVV